MDGTTGTPTVADAGQLHTRLATLKGFRDAAAEELKDAGGINPELVAEMRKLDEAIRKLNIEIFLARGKRITRGHATRERCPDCKRFLPAAHSTDGE